MSEQTTHSGIIIQKNANIGGLSLECNCLLDTNGHMYVLRYSDQQQALLDDRLSCLQDKKAQISGSLHDIPGYPFPLLAISALEITHENI